MRSRTAYGLPRSMFGSRMMRLDSAPDGPPVPPMEPNNADPQRVARTPDISQARELLLEQGFQLFDPAEMHAFKVKEREAAEKEAAALQKQLETIRAEHAKLADWKAELDNKGKSEAELWSERQRAWEASNREKEAAIAAAKKEAAAVQKQLAKERVENRLRGVLEGATNSDAALMWAERHIGKLLSTNDSGDLVWTDPTGIPHEGPAAVKLVSDWWNSDTQKFLRASSPPGPPTSGSPAAPPPSAPKQFQPDPSKSQMENYLAAEDWDRKHGPK